MGYKLLGFAVWQGGTWYLRRRMRGSARKVAIIGAASVAAIGAAAVLRQQGSG